MAVQHKKQRLILGISGASGVIYGVRLLEKLRDSDIETHLVMTKAAEMTLASETTYKPADIYKLANTHHPIGHVGASIASGSFNAMGMIVAPCSVKTMSEIACGIGGNLLTRAADVCLKERRRLVLMVRETPLHTGHLRRMAELSEMGAIIAPPAPGFYTQPETIDDLIDQSVGRLLDLFGIESGIPRWGEEYGLKSQD